MFLLILNIVFKVFDKINCQEIHEHRVNDGVFKITLFSIEVLVNLIVFDKINFQALIL
jgi:hypothetical protein